MRRIDTIKRAASNLRRAKIRTILTSLAIAVGATTIALAMAAGKGGNAYVDYTASKIGDVNALSVYRKFESSSTKDSDAPKKISDKKQDQNPSFADVSMNKDDIAKISKIKGVTSANPDLGIEAESLQFEGGEAVEVNNIKTKVDQKAIELTAGKLSEKNQLNSGEIVLAKAYLDTFKKSAEEVIGKKITINFSKFGQNEKFSRDFKIVAVDAGKTDTTFFYQNDLVISNKDGIEISDLRGVGDRFYRVSVNVASPDQIDRVKDEITKLEGGRYSASSFKDEKKTVATAIDVMAAGLAALGGLAVLASVFGIINTQYISVLERTSQIGLMKSLGAKSKEVARLFRYEAAWIGFLGGMIGLFVAWMITLLNPIISQALNLKGISLLQMDLLHSFVLVASLILIAVASGYFPARKAAKLNPIEALRTE